MAFSANLISPHLSLAKARPNLLRSNQIYRCSLSASTPSSSTFDLRSYWTALILEIDRKLGEAIPVRYPNVIYEAMRYSVLSVGGKRAPPVMCVAACELFGAPREAAFPTACALEMLHAASLIHDDLPCMDDDPNRRGKPSNHAIFGVDMAILAGDALFPLGFSHIMTETTPDLVPESRVLRVVAEMARTVGSTGMAAGQLIELHDRFDNSMDMVEYIVEKKFGEMAECSAVCGGILAGAEEEDVERLRRYGKAIGVLYQVVDEILEEKEKKRKNGKRASYVGVLGLEKAKEVAEELKKKAKVEVQGFEGRFKERVAPLYSFVDYAVERGFEVNAADGKMAENGVYM